MKFASVHINFLIPFYSPLLSICVLALPVKEAGEILSLYFRPYTPPLSKRFSLLKKEDYKIKFNHQNI